MSFHEWCNQQERFYDRMPSWYWNHSKREEVYRQYVIFTNQNEKRKR